MKKYYFSILVLMVANSISAQIINTYAGTGVAGFSGDGGQATSAQLHRPYGLCFDSSGTLYFADANNLRIRKVTASGIITTISGNGLVRYSGDGGPATSASMTHPYCIVMDRSGDLIFSDADTPRLRKISTAGIITTIAGTGVQGYSGDGGQATNATIRGIPDILFDSVGNMIIADAGNHCIRKITTAGIISTMAGTGTLGFGGDGGPATAAILHGPGGIALDSAGNLYIGDGGNFHIRKVSTSGIISSIAGTGVNAYSGDGGPASAAGIGNIGDLLINSHYLYFCDKNHGVIRAIDLSTGIVNTVIGDGTTCGFGGDGGSATAAKLCGPYCMAVDKYGTIYFTDMNNNRIRYIRSIVDVKDANAPKSELLITPNPAISGVFTLKLVNDIDQSAHVVITNAVGVKVKELDCPVNRETEMQLNAPPGLYTVTVTTEHGSWSGRIVVER